MSDMAARLLFTIVSCFFVCQVYAQCGVNNVVVKKHLNPVAIGHTVTLDWIVDISAIRINSFFCVKADPHASIAGYDPLESKHFLRANSKKDSYQHDLLRRTSIGMTVEGKKQIFTISITDVGVKDAGKYECFLEKRFSDMVCFDGGNAELKVLNCSSNILKCENMTVRECASNPKLKDMCPKLCGQCPKIHCTDLWANIACKNWKYHCARKMVQKNCAASCNTCPPPPTLPPTPPPTQPPPCKDKINNCHSLKSMCLSSWTIRANCKRTCKQCYSDKKGKTTLPPITEGPLGSCGYPLVVKRNNVVAGTDADPGSWPWQVSLQVGGKHSCGGSIISDRWIVTAAHCVFRDSTYPDTFTVVLGEHNRKIPSGHEVIMSVEKVVVHQHWDYTTFDYDIALLKTTDSITMNDFIHPVCLPTDKPAVGDACYITGWGRSVALGNATEILQQGRLKIVSNEDCQGRHKGFIDIDVTSRMMCAGDDVRKMTSGCQGDSGGPLVCNAGGRWELQGAVSYGSEMCDASKAYTVFARITSLKPWIYQMMRSL